MKNIKLIKSPSFYYDGQNIFYNLEDIKDKNSLVTKISTGIIKKEYFDDFVENSLKEDKQIYIYTIDEENVKCCAI